MGDAIVLEDGQTLPCERLSDKRHIVVFGDQPAEHKVPGEKLSHTKEAAVGAVHTVLPCELAAADIVSEC